MRAAIPNTCFRPSLVLSLSYLARDLCYASALIYATTYIEILPSTALRCLAWAFYGFLQGCVGTGLWIIAHECGHGAFSSYNTANSLIGWTLHSILLVPFFSWKITHARHHRFTNHLDKDTAFVPLTESAYSGERKFAAQDIAEMVEDTPMMTLVTLVGHQLIGMPIYLLFYLSGGKKSQPLGTLSNPELSISVIAGGYNHFNPFAQLFVPSQRLSILLSDVGILIVAGLVYLLYLHSGLLQVCCLYFFPYLWVNHWIGTSRATLFLGRRVAANFFMLVMITYLQHTHPSIPHYSGQSWTYLKGSLSTVDRSVGFLGRHFFHEIIDYHVVHHLFARIPFYHAEEATQAIMPLLGDLYKHDKQSSYLGTFWTTFRDCYYVSEATGTDGSLSTGEYYWQKPSARTGK